MVNKSDIRRYQTLIYRATWFDVLRAIYPNICKIAIFPQDKIVTVPRICIPDVLLGRSGKSKLANSSNSSPCCKHHRDWKFVIGIARGLINATFYRRIFSFARTIIRFLSRVALRGDGTSRDTSTRKHTSPECASESIFPRTRRKPRAGLILFLLSAVEKIRCCTECVYRSTCLAVT